MSHQDHVDLLPTTSSEFLSEVFSASVPDQKPTRASIASSVPDFVDVLYDCTQAYAKSLGQTWEETNFHDDQWSRFYNLTCLPQLISASNSVQKPTRAPITSSLPDYIDVLYDCTQAYAKSLGQTWMETNFEDHRWSRFYHFTCLPELISTRASNASSLSDYVDVLFDCTQAYAKSLGQTWNQTWMETNFEDDQWSRFFHVTCLPEINQFKSSIMPDVPTDGFLLPGMVLSTSFPVYPSATRSWQTLTSISPTFHSSSAFLSATMSSSPISQSYRIDEIPSLN